MTSSPRGAPLRYGAIGCGRVFERFHLPCLHAAPGVEVVALCDADPNRLAEAAGWVPDAAVFTTPEELLDLPELDAVSICTPNAAHVEPAVAAARRGIAVLCEKPLGATLDEARAIADAAGAAPFGVNLCYRFHDLLPRLREEIDGKTVHVEFDFSTPGQRAWKPVGQWYGDAERAGGGALLDLGLHALDVLVSLLGPGSVVACTVDDPAVEESVDVRLEFDSGDADLYVRRAARRFGMTCRVEAPGLQVELDFRRGVLTAGGEEVASTTQRCEYAAIEGFLASLRGEDGVVVEPAEALALQELVDAAYALARPSGAGAARPQES